MNDAGPGRRRRSLAHQGGWACRKIEANGTHDPASGVAATILRIKVPVLNSTATALTVQSNWLRASRMFLHFASPLKNRGT